MPASRRYATAGAFRQALEERLKTISHEEGTDFQRLCRQVAFDRFLTRLARVDSANWILKGGYAMELRFDTARSTRDLDFTLREGNHDTPLLLLQRAASFDLEDFFAFRVGEAIADLDAAPYGGARHPVEARVDGRAFVRFHVDAGIGDVILEPIETLAARDWLAFAEIVPPSISMIAREQQFAEKIHAYSLPRTNPNSRVRDLVDLYLLIVSRTLDRARCADALRRTFERRATHEVPTELTPPPPAWTRPFRALADDCELEIECQAAFQTLQEFWTGLLG
ncbi:MAG: nucleotidyl transferase AbiEii/AbiGii toxin family protein [Bryobacteraceae bacterium]|nr:nucleotidyl transferase AbiEii/AbiGii toxin family protein [Bryobacteraceae bacterium]